MESRSLASTDDVTLALHHLGGSGPTLLIAHATGFHGRAYQVLADGLTDRYDVWAVDLRGHGASSAPASGDFSWVGMADDVLAAIDSLGGGPVWAVGHSMGGASLLLAEQRRPGVLRSAYLFEPIVFPYDPPVGRENPMAGPARRRRAVFESRAAALERYGSRPPLNTLDPRALADYVEFGFVDTADGQVTLACEPEHEARTFEAEDKMTVDSIRGLPLDAVIASAPALVDSPAMWAPPIAEAIDGARLVIYDHLNHFGPLQAPAEIAHEITKAFPQPNRGQTP